MSYPPQHSQVPPYQPEHSSSPNDEIQCLSLKSLEERGLIQEEDGARFIKVDLSEAFRLQRQHIIVDKLARLPPSRPASVAMAEFKVCELLIKLINEKEQKENKLIEQIRTLQDELSQLRQQHSRSPTNDLKPDQELPNQPQPQEGRGHELKNSLQFFKNQTSPKEKSGNPKGTAGKQHWEAEEKKESQQEGMIVTPRQEDRKEENQEFPLATTEAKEEPQERERRRQRKAKRGDRKRHKFTRINYDF